MENKIIYSVTGLFDSPDKIIHASKMTEEAGYKKWDVHSPYPVHGMFRAMKLKPSKLGYFALAIGLSGTFLALFFMWWVTSIDYPLVIGGKPFFALPAFIPIIFEVTVLMATVGTVFAMLIFFFKLPNNSHPLHDTDYMKSVSVDKYGLSIESKDGKFNEEETKQFINSLGAYKVDTIYFDDELINFKPKTLDFKFVSFLIFVVILVGGATYFSLNKLMYMPPFNWMSEQPRLNVQSASSIFSDGNGNRLSVDGSVARGYMPYQYHGQPELAVNLINPMIKTMENLEVGKKKYNTYCSPCHDYFGKGSARLNGQFPNPPSLHSDKLLNWKDGQIFHVITDGQNIMPSYAKQLTVEERWNIVLYIRALQRALNAKEEDL